MRDSTSIKQPFAFLRRYAPLWTVFFLLWIWFIYEDSAVAFAYEPILISILIGSVMYGRWKSGRRTWKVSPFIFVLAAFIIYLGILLISTPLPQYSLDKVIQAISILFIFLYVKQQTSGEDQAKMWEGALITVVMLLSVWELSYFFPWYERWVRISGSVFSPPPIGFRLTGAILPGANFTAALLNLVLPLLIARLILANGRQKRWWGSLVFVLVVVEYFASSRSSWFAALSAAAVTLVFFYGPRLKGIWAERKLPNPIASRKWVGVLSMGFIIVLTLAFLFVRQVRSTPGHRGLLSGRENIWANSLAIWTESPWTGGGAGSFPLNYAQISGKPPGWMPDQAHNMWLQIGVEMGIIGLVFVVVMAALLLRSVFQAWRREAGNRYLRVQLSAFMGIGMAVFVQHQADYYFHIPLYTIIVLLLVALALHHSKPKNLRVPNFSANLILFALLAFYAWGSWYTVQGGDLQIQGYLAFIDNNVEEAEYRVCAAAQETPQFTVYSFQCGVLAAELFHLSGDESKLEAALASMEQGLEVDPYWPIHWANLGILQWQRGEQDDAISSIQRAAEKAPHNTLFTINFAWMAEQLTMDDLATEAYQQALEIDPWLLESPFFHETELRSSLLEKEYSHDLGTDDASALEAYRSLAAGDLAGAQAALDQALAYNPRHPEAVAIMSVLDQRRGDEELAWQHARTAILFDRGRRAEDQNPRVYVWGSSVALDQGRTAQAAAWIRRSLTLWKGKIQYDTRDYYYAVYHRYLLFDSFVPGYQRADYTPEMAEAFFWLEEYYRNAGNLLAAEEVHLWLNSDYGLVY